MWGRGEKRQRGKGGGEGEVGKDGTHFPAIALQGQQGRRNPSPQGSWAPRPQQAHSTGH